LHHIYENNVLTVPVDFPRFGQSSMWSAKLMLRCEILFDLHGAAYGTHAMCYFLFLSGACQTLVTMKFPTT